MASDRPRAAPGRVSPLRMRLLASHLLIALLCLAVFGGILALATDRSAAAAGLQADRLIAIRLAPSVARLLAAAAPPEAARGGDALGEALARAFDDRAPDAPMMMPMGPTMMPRRRSDDDIVAAIRQPVVVLGREGEVLAALNVDQRRIDEWRSREVRRDRLDAGVPIVLDGRRLGTLFVGAMIAPDTSAVQAFIERQILRSSLIAAAVMAVIAGAVGWYVARWIGAPIAALAAGTRQIAAGAWSARVPERGGSDELSSLERSFNRMAAEIERQEASRRQFVADAAHELRTPLALIRARVEMLADGVYAPGPDQWSALTRAAGRLQTLLDDLQMLARVDAGRVSLTMRAVDVPAALAVAADAFRPAADEKGVALVVDVGPADAGELAVVADPARLDQIIANLVANALRYAPVGGYVTIRAAADGRGGPGGAVTIAVEDDGPGVPLADRERIFERFVRLDDGRSRDSGGSGLGLPIARELARLQGADLFVEDRDDAPGARFVLRFPAYRA